MKNREKFRDEILKAFEGLFNYGTDRRACMFMKKQVIPNYDLENSVKEEGTCGGVTCIDCAKMFAFWLDEEYVEPQKPEVDWSKVPVDTLVRVRDYENVDWYLRYFKGIDKSNPEEKYEAWSNGTTSKTSNDKYVHWKYCELEEDEDDSNQNGI